MESWHCGASGCCTVRGEAEARSGRLYDPVKPEQPPHTTSCGGIFCAGCQKKFHFQCCLFWQEKPQFDTKPSQEATEAKTHPEASKTRRLGVMWGFPHGSKQGELIISNPRKANKDVSTGVKKSLPVKPGMCCVSTGTFLLSCFLPLP